MEQQDSHVTKTLIQFALGLVVFTAIIFTIAGMMTDDFYGNDKAAMVDDAAVAERIAPVAMVKEAGSASAEAAAPAAKSGKDIYAASCFACHGTGAAGAPKLGDKAAWSARIAQGMSTLVSVATNGKGAMPAKGGNPALSDADMQSVVEYMVAESK